MNQITPFRLPWVPKYWAHGSQAADPDHPGRAQIVNAIRHPTTKVVLASEARVEVFMDSYKKGQRYGYCTVLFLDL